MADLFPAGQYVRGYLASNDMTTAVVVPLVDAEGKSVTVPVGKRLVLDEVLLANGGTASVITLFADTNGGGTLDAGEELLSISLAINSSQPFPAAGSGNIPLPSIKSSPANNNKLLVVASAASANSRVVVIGRIINS